MAVSLQQWIGLPPERLSIADRRALAGQWMALELYSPRTLPLRVIAALGATPADCARALRTQGLDPTKYEFLPVSAPF